jgi:hypothetical protein
LCEEDKYSIFTFSVPWSTVTFVVLCGEVSQNVQYTGGLDFDLIYGLFVVE